MSVSQSQSDSTLVSIVAYLLLVCLRYGQQGVHRDAKPAVRANAINTDVNDKDQDMLVSVPREIAARQPDQLRPRASEIRGFVEHFHRAELVHRSDFETIRVAVY